MPITRQAQTNRRAELKRGLARYLRAHATKAERQCWALLRHKQIAHLRFRRQQPIGPFVVDFYCASAKLIVELDGGQHHHLANMLHDQARTDWLEGRGYCVLRFGNIDFLKNREAIIERICRAIESRTPPRSAFGASTLPQGEGEIA